MNSKSLSHIPETTSRVSSTRLWPIKLIEFPISSAHNVRRQNVINYSLEHRQIRTLNVSNSLGDNTYMRSVPSRKTRINKTAASRSTNPRSQKSADAPKSALVQQIGATNSGSTLEPRINQLNPAKRTRNRVPPPQRERILQKYVDGKSISDISKEENRNRETVGKIVRGPEMQEYVRTMRERFYGLGGDAISAIQHTLQQENDGRLGFQVLASIGVIPSPEERQLLAASLAATGSDEEAEEAGVKRYLGLANEHAIEIASMFGRRCPELDADLEKEGCRINYETGKIEPVEKKTAT